MLTPPSPILIASPVRRSGTTLLQRLLCSAPNALIYGESCANDLYMSSNMLLGKQLYFKPSMGWRNGQLETVLQGQVNDWIPDLMPELEGYLQYYREAFLSLTRYYGHFASEKGRPIWGCKLPEWNPANLVQLMKLMPGCKVIYLHRNLEDCMRSAKRIGMISSLDEVRQYCLMWRQFTDHARLQLRGGQVLHLHFESLTDQPTTTIQLLENFTGANGIHAAVFQEKINTYKSDERLAEAGQPYLLPADLSEDETALAAAVSLGKMQGDYTVDITIHQ